MQPAIAYSAADGGVMREKSDMRNIIFISLFASSVAQAENLCPINENREAEFRIEEGYFTAENARNAVQELNDIVSGAQTEYEWFSVPNLLKVIQGYVLRRDALKNDASENYKSEFCSFMKTSAWWYD